MKKTITLIIVGMLALLYGCQQDLEEREIMWDINELSHQEVNSWDVGLNYSSNIKAIFYQGQIYKDEQTQIFAYLGIPTSEMPEGGYPAIILVHGGLGRAFPDWVKMWTDKGYVAIAPDFDAQMSSPQSGLNTIISNPHGGPKGYGVRAEDLLDQKEDSWVYQSVSNIVFANNLLRSMDNVNQDKVGITGISWGSYLSAITVGVDNRFAFAMPVYGAGYLDEDYGSSLYSMFAAMSDEMLDVYRKYYDPAAYLAYNTAPTFWMQGVKDYAFSPVLKQKAINLIQDIDVQYAYYENMTHGQEQGSSPKELFAYADSIVKGQKSIIKITKESFSNFLIHVETNDHVDISTAYLYWTDSPDYEIHTASWYRLDVTLSSREIDASVPEGATYAFIEINDALGNKISSKFYEVLS